MKLEGERLAGRLFETLARLTADPPGVTRAAYGAGEQLAHDQLAAAATAIGLGVTTDAAGNLYMTQTGRDRSAPGLFIGSHLDTVPHGGNYDGAAGVIAGVAALAILAETGQSPAQDVTVMAIRAEEAAWFPLSYLGSKAALG
ncbi:MAG: M28 family peptidase, partial [Pseudomonadota bacterium]